MSLKTRNGRKSIPNLGSDVLELLLVFDSQVLLLLQPLAK